MASTKAMQLIRKLQERGFELAVRGDRLCIRPASKLTAQVRQVLGQHRASLIAALSADREAAAAADDPPQESPLEPDCFEDMPAQSRARSPHDPPTRGCFACDGREFVRVKGGPAWFCPRCHPPGPGTEVVERHVVQAPGLREVWRA